VAVSVSAAPGRWDWDALRAGAVVCLVFAVPLTVIAAIVDSDDSGVNALFFFGAAFGFVVGGGCAAWVQRRGTPISHGIVAAGGSYVIAQAVFVVVRLAAGREVNWYGALFTLSLVLTAGLLGGYLGRRLQDKGITPSSVRHEPRGGTR
jgi:peptidoglycan/LPS O-acetylase OafA/YrhL